MPCRADCVIKCFFIGTFMSRLNFRLIVQAPVVGKVDNAIHRINHYPVDSVVCFVNTYPLDSNLSSG